jgi:hypothetical protein
MENYNSFFQKGKESELKFANKHLTNVTMANKNQDMFEHWDVEGICAVISLDKLKFDVKGLKKTNRSDNQYQDENAWLEGTAVNGRKGWLKGMADYIVFERNNNWLVVNRKELLNFTMSKLKENNYKIGKGKYMIYTRLNRKDKITLVPFEDIKKLSSIIELEK